MKELAYYKEAVSCPVASVSTPFQKDGAIDYDALRNDIDFIIAGGSKTVLLTHGDSLYTLLTDDEVAEVTRVTVEHTAGRAMVVSADNIWATPKSLEFARFTREIGVDVYMVLPPDWAQSCTVETLVEHHAAIAAEIPVMIVTNWLAPRPMPFREEFLTAICDRVPGVVALKDDLCNEFARRMGLLVHERMAVFSGGQKQNHLNNLPYGCDGYLSTFARFNPAIAQAYWRAIRSNDIEKATRIIRDYDMPLFDYIGKLQGGFDAGIHGLIELVGVGKRWRRKPYYSLSDEELDHLAAFLKGKGML